MNLIQITIAGVASLLLISAAIFFMKAAWCEIRAKDMGVSSKYTVVSGCLVSDNEKIWIAPDKFRNTVD